MSRSKGDGLGKIGGRVKGTPNKVTSDAKKVLVQIIENNMEKAQTMLDMIVEPKEWLLTYIKLMEFVIPKKAAVQVSPGTTLSDLKSELEEMANSED